MATISSRLDEQGNWVVIEAEASGAFSKTVGGEGNSPLTAFQRSISIISTVTDQISIGLAASRGVTVEFGVKILPTGEVMIASGLDSASSRSR